MDLSRYHRNLSALTDAVWVERSLTEQLLFRLVTTELVLRARLGRYLPRALEEVDAQVERLWTAEAQRLRAARDVAADGDQRASRVTLPALAAAPEPWGAMFAEHADAFSALAAEIDRVADATRRLARESLGGLTAAVAAHPGRMGTSAIQLLLDTHDNAGMPGAPDEGPGEEADSVVAEAERQELALQQIACEATLLGLGGVLPPSLLGFLGTSAGWDRDGAYRLTPDTGGF